MKIGIILGSVREGRSGERVAKWVLKSFSRQPEEVQAEILDLKDYPLPYYAEADLPSVIKAGDYKDQTANRWADKISSLDGFIIVNPEYNHGYSAVLKNALDYLGSQWADKPVSFVSYSSGAIGGARAVEQLRQVTANLKLVTLQEALHIGKVKETISENGDVISGPFDSILDKQLAQMLVWTKLLNDKRLK